jgi:hypothetical protein
VAQLHNIAADLALEVDCASIPVFTMDNLLKEDFGISIRSESIWKGLLPGLRNRGTTSAPLGPRTRSFEQRYHGLAGTF